jgi:hypothetical protein
MDLYKKHYAELEEIINTRLGMAIDDEKFNADLSTHRHAKQYAIDDAKDWLIKSGVPSRQGSSIVNKVWREIKQESE